MNQGMAEAVGSALRDTVQLHSSDLLRFRLRKLLRETANKISTRTQMFDPQRTSEDLADAIEYFPMFLTTYLAIAWSIYVANAIPGEDAQVYSSRYLDLDVDHNSFLSVLAGHVIERNLLPDYRLGFMTAMLKACHMTKQIDAQKRLWSEFTSQLSNLFTSVCAYTEFGVYAFEEFVKSHTKADSVAK